MQLPVIEHHSTGPNPIHSCTVWCAECRDFTAVWDVQNDEDYDGLEPEGISCGACHEPYAMDARALYEVTISGMRSAVSSGRIEGTVQL